MTSAMRGRRRTLTVRRFVLSLKQAGGGAESQEEGQMGFVQFHGFLIWFRENHGGGTLLHLTTDSLRPCVRKAGKLLRICKKCRSVALNPLKPFRTLAR